MRDERFRNEQWEHLFDPHVAPVNRYVDELRQAGRGWVPYVAPLHGGVDARVLSVLRDPGPGTQDGSGSGFLCVENDDPAADAAPDGAKLRAGLPTLVRFLELAPRVEVLLLQGGEAQRSGRMLKRHHPEVLSRRKLAIIESYHPARSALRSPDPAERERRSGQRITQLHLPGSGSCDDCHVLDPAAVADIMSDVVRWWGVAGDWAIDLWRGVQSREHHDIGVGVRRCDQQVLHRCPIERVGAELYRPAWQPLAGLER